MHKYKTQVQPKYQLTNNYRNFKLTGNSNIKKKTEKQKQTTNFQQLKYI